ncbi:helix-turn-helix domain-containing protein [Pseudonocardia hispaniensis]|uniref:Helix-turn-helix domain-containing protein n=1 Tax=Pseudonocardia hispaniensis TaxID=904933 RepID=A0ABW1J8X4_9PSEU
MSPTDLAAAVKARRHELGLGKEQLRKRGGPSHQTVRNIERGVETRLNELTYSKLDRALGWTPGSAARLLDDGAPPTLATTPAPAPEAVSLSAEDARALAIGRAVLALVHALDHRHATPGRGTDD